MQIALWPSFECLKMVLSTTPSEPLTTLLCIDRFSVSLFLICIDVIAHASKEGVNALGVAGIS